MAEKDHFETVTVFQNGRDGYRIFRIPAIIRAANGDLLAFCEARAGGDQSEIDLVLKRSSDGGRTWKKLEIAQESDDFKSFFDPGKTDITVGNPAPVVDTMDPEHPGRIWLPFSLENDRVFVTFSDDHGRTWAKARDITRDVKKPEWGWYATGPVHSIQIEHGRFRGRLVVPCDHRIGTGGEDRGALGAHVIFSDDHGKTWRLGAIDDTYRDGLNANETTVVELNDGRLYFNTRDHNGPAQGTRGEVFSSNGGASFDPSGDPLYRVFKPSPRLLDPPVVQCAVLRVWSTRRGDRQNLILFSGPDEDGPSGKGRSDLRIRYSTDEAASWHDGPLIHEGPAAYSDMVRLDNGQVGVLFEAGDKGKGRYDTIRFARLKIGDVLPAVKKHAGAAAEPSLFPLSRVEMHNESTLDPQILSDSTVPGRGDAPRKLRWLEVRYFSHRWKDGPWYGKVHIVIPDSIPEDRRGLVVMCPIGSAHVRKGVDIRRDFFEETARRFQIPVVSIPAMGEHLGASQIHQMSDGLMMKFLETGDPAWLPGYATCAVRSRALTLVGHLTGHRVTRAIHLGSSISAHQAWIWPLYDARVAALIATGDTGFQRDKYPADRSFKLPKRPVFEAIFQASAELQQQLLEHTDPYLFGDRLKVPILQIAGTNDFASPPSTVDSFLDSMGGPVHRVNVPGYAHGCGSRRHVAALHMWIDHVFFGRPLTSIRVLDAHYVSGKAVVTARIASHGTEPEDVRFFYATASHPGFLRSRFLKTTPRDNHIRAKWESVAMRCVDRQSHVWQATVEFSGNRPRFIAGFVDVQDRAGSTTGFASSRMLWLEDGFRSLFDGRTLDGWQGATELYSAEDGILVCREPKPGEKLPSQNLYSSKVYRDFILRFEFRLTPGANNGIAIRSPLKGRPSRDGLEIQILDDTAEKYRNLAPHQYNGSVYLLAPAERGHLRPVGQWNEEEIRVVGSRVTVILNRAVIVETDLEHPEYTKYLDQAKGRLRREGHIGFCGHSSRVEFRNIRIREAVRNENSVTDEQG